MALVVKDRVKQTTTTTGTGSIVLNGNVDGFQTFAAALANGDTTYYGIFVPSTNAYEVGLGTWTESTATLARTTILESSNSGSAVNLTAQAEVFITQPAEKAVFQNSNGDVDLGGNKILFGNLYSTTGDLPSASTYHGMFAHVHGTGKAYYAHAGNWIELVNEDTSGNVSMGGNLTVTGDLTVNGTTTTVNTTNTVVTDSLIELANGTTGSPSNDAGIVIERGDSNNAFIGYDESADKFTVGTGSFTGASTGNLTITTGTLVANVEGNVTGDLTGTASSATNADTVDSLHASSFLRSDAADTKTSGDLTFSDSVKAIFGAGSDLQIYHDGSNSYISEQGTGGLRILNDTNIAFKNAANTENKAIFKTDAEVELYYNGNLKFETTNTGVDVTGTVTADGLTVDTNTLHVDATNNRVGVGTTSPTTPFTLEAAGSTSASENTHLRINDTTNMAAGVGGVIQLSGEADSGGTTQYTFATIKGIKENGTTGNYDGALTFATRANGVSPASEAMRIDSSGSLLHGTTNDSIGSSSTEDGIVLNASGTIAATRGGNIAAVFNRRTDDGDIVHFRKDGTTVGDIGTSSSNLHISSAVQDKDILFQGNDGGSTVTALTLDMSAAGAATFNAGANFGGNVDINGNLNAVDSIYVADYVIHEGDTNTFAHFTTDEIRLTAGGSQEVTITPTGVQLGDTGNGYFQPVTGGYGSIQIDGGAHGAYEGYSIGGRAVFMHNNSTTTLIYDDVNDKRMFAGTHGGAVQLYHNGTSKIDTTSSGVNIDGDLNAVDNIYLASGLIHEGDTDTYLGFSTNAINLYTGGTLSQFSSSGLFITDGSLAEDYDALSGTTPTCNVDNGGMFSLTMTGNTTFTFSGASSGYIQGFVLQLTGNGSTVTYPASVKWAGGTAPDAPANGETDILVFITRDGGTNWYGVLSSDAAS